MTAWSSGWLAHFFVPPKWCSRAVNYSAETIHKKCESWVTIHFRLMKRITALRFDTQSRIDSLQCINSLLRIDSQMCINSWIRIDSYIGCSSQTIYHWAKVLELYYVKLGFALIIPSFDSWKRINCWKWINSYTWIDSQKESILAKNESIHVSWANLAKMNRFTVLESQNRLSTRGNHTK